MEEGFSDVKFTAAVDSFRLARFLTTAGRVSRSNNNNNRYCHISYAYTEGKKLYISSSEVPNTLYNVEGGPIGSKTP